MTSRFGATQKATPGPGIMKAPQKSTFSPWGVAVFFCWNRHVKTSIISLGAVEVIFKQLGVGGHELQQRCRNQAVAWN